MHLSRHQLPMPLHMVRSAPWTPSLIPSLPERPYYICRILVADRFTCPPAIPKASGTCSSTKPACAHDSLLSRFPREAFSILQAPSPHVVDPPEQSYTIQRTHLKVQSHGNRVDLFSSLASSFLRNVVQMVLAVFCQQRQAHLFPTDPHGP